MSQTQESIFSAFEELVRRTLEHHSLYSVLLNDDQGGFPWDVKTVTQAVQATVEHKGEELDDGYNPSLDSALSFISQGHTDACVNGQYMMLSVICDHILLEIINC